MTLQLPPGSRVRDTHGRIWIRTGDTGGSDWELETTINRGVFEPESWTRVCQYEPLTCPKCGTTSCLEDKALDW